MATAIAFVSRCQSGSGVFGRLHKFEASQVLRYVGLTELDDFCASEWVMDLVCSNELILGIVIWVSVFPLYWYVHMMRYFHGMGIPTMYITSSPVWHFYFMVIRITCVFAFHEYFHE